MKKTNIRQPGAQFIVFSSSLSVFIRWKWREFSNITSLRLTHTSSDLQFPDNSVATNNKNWMRQAVIKWGVNRESLRMHHSTAARYKDGIDCDVTRLVLMERVLKKYSILESFTLYCSRTLLINWQRQIDGILAQ